MTEYGKTVKKKLIDLDKSQAWLISEVKNETSLYLDSAYLSHILTGKRNAPKIKTIINNILDIKEN